MENLTYYSKFKNIILLISVIFFSYTLNAQTGLWVGSVDNNWQTSANWADNTVPDSTVDVTIQSAKSFYPLIDNTGEQCKSLIVEDGAKLTMCIGGNLTVNGDLTVGKGSSGILEGECGSLTITGQLILNSGASVTITDCSIICSSFNINPTSTVTYDGTEMNIYNWNYGNLILNGTGTMQITGDAATPTTCSNLTVNNTGNILKIPANKALTVNGILTNNIGSSGIVIESTSSGDGSLILSTSNVNATVNRYVTGSNWHYLSAPIDNAPLTLFNTNNFLWWDATMEWGGSGDYNPWKSYSDTYLVNGQGYAYYDNETTIGYSGAMNVSDYNVTLYKSSTGNADDQGWNLIGNPYTSILDWDDAVADGAVPAGTENAIYFFDDDGTGAQTNYRYYVPSSGGTYGVGTGNATGSIPLGQAFFLKTNTDNVTLSIKKGYRSHSPETFYKNNNQSIIKLSLNGNTTSDQLIYRVIDNSTFGFDKNYDARKLLSSEIPQLYSISNDKIAINSIPEIIDKTKLDLGFKAAKGEYEIVLNEFNVSDFINVEDIYLLDKYTDKIINLNTLKKYNFSHDGGEITDRFTLLFEKNTSNINLNNNNSVTIYPNPVKNFLYIESKNNSFANVKIISVSGKICFSSKIENKKAQINMSEFSNGIYFVKLTLNDGSILNKRVIVNN